MNKKLKVGLLCNSLKIKNWEYVMIEKILQSDFIELNLVIINDNRVNENSFFSKIINNKNNLLQILYQNLDEKIFDVRYAKILDLLIQYLSQKSNDKILHKYPSS